MTARASHTTVVRAFAAPSVLPLAEDGGAPLPVEILFLPEGTTRIDASSDLEGGYHGQVTVDAPSAAKLVASFEALRAAGHRAWIDADHTNGAALGDVRALRWQDGRGLLARVDWTPLGERALRERAYASFSPVFLLDRQTSRPLGLPAGEALGALVNAPAFGTRLQLIAARAALPATANENTQAPMNKIAQLLGLAENSTEEQILAALAALKDGPKKEEISAALTKLQAAEGELVKAKAEAERLKQELAARPAHIAAAAHVSVAKSDLVDTIKAYAAARPNPSDAAVIYARDIGPRIGKDVCGRELLRVLAANSLGTLAGDLITQNALSLLKLQLPILGRVTTDFSRENTALGQTIKTRTRSIPGISVYDPANGYAKQAAGTADVPVTISQNIGVPLEFTVNELGSTSRDLFGEQAEGASYAIGKYMVDALYALILNANFANKTTKATASLALVDLRDMAKALNGRGVPPLNRTLLLNSDAFAKLMSDATVANLASYQRPDLVANYALPPLAGFMPYEAVNLPANGESLTGFGFTPDALVIATRVPNDYTNALSGGATHGAVSTVTNADTGISVQLVQYVNHDLARATWRMAVMFGVAKGQVASGQRLTSA